MQKNIVKDRILQSPLNHLWTPRDLSPGSFYTHLSNEVRKNIEENGDWIWLHNRMNGSKLMASDFELMARKFAVIFKNLNVQKNDIIHLICGNDNLTYSICGGIWILGAIPSLGSDEENLNSQLKDTNAKIVILSPEMAEKLDSKKLDDNKKKIQFLCLGQNEQFEDILEMFDQVEENEAPDPVEIKNGKNQICVIFWNSNSGLPKGICHSHYGAYHFSGFSKSLLSPNQSSVASTCFFHVGGFFTGIIALEKCQTFHHVSKSYLSISTHP